MNLSTHKHITFFSNNFWTLYKFREDAINLFIKNGYKVNLIGKYDGFEQKFSDVNINKYNLVVGMYHDQVLAPIKTLYKFDEINITLGLPFIRISPDHGTNNEMLGKNNSDPKSLFSSFNFFKKLSEN